MTDLDQIDDAIADIKTLPDFALNEKQLDAVQHIKEWFHSSRQYWTLGGYAGTGKTTVIRRVLADLNLDVDSVMLCAYAAKGAAVIRQKTPPFKASTIHGLIYRPRTNPQIEKLQTKLADLRRQPRTPELSQEIADVSAKLKVLKRKHGAVRFRLKTQQEFDAQYPTLQLVVADECSMIGEKIFNHLLSFGVKVLFLGDPGQLDPINLDKGERTLHELAPSNFLLETIMRNDAAIVKMAAKARNQQWISYQTISEGFGKIPQSKIIQSTALETADQIICHRHITRRMLNQRVRNAHGYTGRYPMRGEKIVCKLNCPDFDLCNGVTYTMRENAVSDGKYLKLDIEGIDEIIDASPILFDAYYDAGLAQDVDAGHIKYSTDAIPFDFGYALTVHSSQGSEWERVIVWDDFAGRQYRPADYAKWLYTAITRAKDVCVVAA